MFTGIVEERGRVVEIERVADAARVAVHGPVVTSDARHGASIAVDGVCLTVVETRGAVFTSDVMAETLARTRLGRLAVGDEVNLERAVAAGARLSGHIVQGHVDGTGTIIAREPGEHWEAVRVAVPRHLARYVVEKGSIAVDGVSLTVASLTVDPAGVDEFTVCLIPTTLALTTLGAAPVGTEVNIEVDVLAKYVERLLRQDGTDVPNLAYRQLLDLEETGPEPSGTPGVPAD
jgi:riboflavin synthase